MEKNGALYLSAKNYVKAAIELMAANCPEGPAQRVAGALEHVRFAANMFQLRDHEFPYWQRSMWSEAQARHALPQYRAFVQAMRENPEVARYLDSSAGTKRGWSHLRSDEIADYLVRRTAEACGRLEFDTVQFDRLFENSCLDLRGEEVGFVAVAPIPGFKSERIPIRLDEHLEIDRLTDEEILRCLGLGISMGLETGGIVHLYGDCGIRYRFAEKRLFGTIQIDSKAIQLDQERMVAAFLSVSHALRLFKKGPVRASAFAIFSVHWPVSNFTNSGAIEPVAAANRYELSGKEAMDFTDFWNDVARARTVPFLDAAIRRFGYAGERHRAEDKLVDLMICAESLFLSDVGEAGERGEMRFRLSLRFGLFAEKEDRVEAFRLMRAAYDARSALVHGGSLDDDALKLPGIGRVPLLQFVDGVEDCLRTALHKAIATKPHSNNKLVDWDAISLGLK